MSSVPYTFANNNGNIPLNQLDANFSNCKAFADTAGYVTANAQANITSVGILTSLTVSGNTSVTGNITANNISANRFTGTLTTAAQPNVTSLGTLVSVSVTGNVMSGNVNTGNASFSGDIVVQGNAIIQGTTTTTNTSNLNVANTTIRLANGAVTTSQINGAGLLAGNPTLASIVYSDLQSAWTTSSNFYAGNIIGANIAQANTINSTGVISASGNIVGDQIFSTLVSASGNVLGGRISSSGNIIASANITAGNLSVTGTTILTGIPTAPTAANGTSNTQIATTAFVSTAVTNGIPTGVIVMWSGSIASIPAGWFLCNGANGTPDLRDRFIVGAGSSYAVGATGGSANATLVSHSHTASSSVTDPGHAHNSVGNGAPNGGGAGIALTNPGNSPGLATAPASTGITVSTSISTAGSSATDANLPPYYALAYIMKS
jgi:hypothetical protein